MEQTSPSQASIWPPRRVVLATLVVLAIAFAFYLLVNFRLVFFSLFIAVVLSTAIEPLVARLARFKIPRPVSLILLSIIVLLLITVLVIVVVPLISNQWATMNSLLSGWYESLHQALSTSPSLLLQRIAGQLPASLHLGAPRAAQPLTPPAPTGGGQPANPQTGDKMQQALQIGNIILRDMILFFSVLLLTGLWMIEGDVATRFFLMALPAQRREPARDFIEDIKRKVGAYTRGLAFLSLIVGVLAGIAYAIIGLPNVLFLGIFAGLMEVVPLIGPLLGAIPAVMVAVSTAPEKVVWVILAYILIQFSESHFIVPRVMDRAVGVNPVVSLLAFIAFGSLFGLMGAMLAVPLAAVIQLILHRLVFDQNPIEQEPPAGRNVISALRYEAQDLVLDVRKQIRGKETEVTAGSDRIEDNMEAIAKDLDSILAEAEKSGNGRPKTNGKAA